MASRRYRPAGDSDEDSDDDIDFSCRLGRNEFWTPQQPIPQMRNEGAGQPSQQLPGHVSQVTGSGWRGRGRGFGRGQSSPYDGSSYQAGRGRGRGRGQLQAGAERQGVPVMQDLTQQPVLTNESLPQEARMWQQAILKKITGLVDAAGIEFGYADKVCRDLKRTWADKSKPFQASVIKVLESCLTEERNIWALGLFCAVQSVCVNPAFPMQKYLGPLSMAVLEGLQGFIKTKKLSSNGPNHDVQEIALEVAILQTRMLVLRVMNGIFRLDESLQKNKFIDVIKEMYTSKRFIDACQCATMFKLQAEFDIHAFLVPLLLQDRYNTVEECIRDVPKLQEEVIQFFDQLFSDGQFAVSGKLVDYVGKHKIGDVRTEKFDFKPVSKLIKRLATQFKTGYKYYPNVSHRQRFGEMRFLFTRRYEKNEMSGESFDELVNQIAEDSSQLKEDILDHYISYGDTKSAARFIAKHELYSSSACLDPSIVSLLPEPHRSRLEQSLNVPTSDNVDENWDDDNTNQQDLTHCRPTDSHIPANTEEDWDNWEDDAVGNNSTFQSDRNSQDSQEDWSDQAGEQEMTSTSKIYYKSNIPVTSVHLISEPAEVKDLCNWLKDSTSTIEGESNWMLSGFDAEWKPLLSKRAGAAILQLAFDKIIYLIDIVTLNQNPTREWTQLRAAYFDNDKILKLGFGLKNDVKMLTDTIYEWKDLSAKWKSVVDLQSIRSLILKEKPEFFKEAQNESGLSELVFQCLGKSLSKAEQMSDWEKRPLRRSQIEYAANDAYCLIDVFRALRDLGNSKDSGIDMNKIVQNYLKGSANPSGSKKTGCTYVALELLLAHQAKEDRTGCSPGTKKFVVDNMLQGLGRYLRALGFNTVVLSDTQKHRMCCRYAEHGRLVITKGVAYNEIVGTVPEENVYNVKSDNSLDQLEEILNFFKIKLNPDEVFSICQCCNMSEFIRVPKVKMMQLLEQTRSSKMMRTDGFLRVEALKMRSPEGLILSSNKNSRNWTLLNDDELIINGESLLTKTGHEVDLTKLHAFAKEIDWLYICNNCGKNYFESAKVEKIIRESLQEKLSKKTA